MSSDPKAPIDRKSLTGGLESMYSESSGQFKKAGTPAAAAPAQNGYETSFKSDGSALTSAAEKYSEKIRVNTVPYAPSGRR